MSAPRLTVDAGRKAVEASGGEVAVLHRHGTLAVDFFAPHGADHITPHARDAAYVVAAGSGTYVTQDASHPVEVGEVIVVPAGTAHHFADTTDDFAAWALFHGPMGGEEE